MHYIQATDDEGIRVAALHGHSLSVLKMELSYICCQSCDTLQRKILDELCLHLAGSHNKLRMVFHILY